jgi:hypothetical protein
MFSLYGTRQVFVSDGNLPEREACTREASEKLKELVGKGLE